MQETQQQVLTSRELMERQGIKRTAFEALARRIPGAYKVGRLWRFPLEAVERWESQGGDRRRQTQ